MNCIITATCEHEGNLLFAAHVARPASGLVSDAVTNLKAEAMKVMTVHMAGHSGDGKLSAADDLDLMEEDVAGNDTGGAAQGAGGTASNRKRRKN